MRTMTLLLACLAVLIGATAAAAGGLPAPRSAPPAQAADVVVEYRLLCAPCHGTDGSGNGWARGNLYPPPANLTDDVWKLHTTPAGALPTDDDLLRVLRRGVAGTSMPGFATSVPIDQLRDLVAYVKTLSPRFARESAPEPYVVPAAPLSGPVGIQNGQEHYMRLGCARCHGADGRAQVDGARDLSANWTFKNGKAAEDIYRSITQGFDGTAMRAYENLASDGQRWEMMFYVRSLARPALWVLNDPARIASLPTGGLSDDRLRGEYLVRALGCGRCHTPFNPDGTFVAERRLSGGTRIVAWPYGIYYAPNLTPDPATGLGGRSTDEIVQMVTGGQKGLLGMARLNPAVMPWPYFARLKPEDARAIAMYLQSLQPVYNAVPAGDGYGFFNTLGAKFSALVLGVPASLEVYPGNAGTPDPAGAPPPEPSLEHRLAAAWGFGVAVMGAVLVYAFLAILHALHVSPGGQRKATLITIALYAAIVLIAAALYLSPLYTYLTPGMAADAAVRMPPSTGLTDPAQQALADRGQYLATIAGCGTCHSPVASSLFASAPPPLAGGLETRWAAFGTRYSGNLTPDATGLQNWTDDDLKYAFQSGRSRNGLMLDWQAMPWDFYSNFTDEDAEAIAIYFLSLAPQAHAVPVLSPPAPDDPQAKVSVFRP